MAKVSVGAGPVGGSGEISKEEAAQMDKWGERQQQKMKPKGNPITSFKPPKEWYLKMHKQIKEKNPTYSEEQIRDTIGDIWYHKIDEQKRVEIRGRYGKKLGASNPGEGYEQMDSTDKTTIDPEHKGIISPEEKGKEIFAHAKNYADNKTAIDKAKIEARPENERFDFASGLLEMLYVDRAIIYLGMKYDDAEKYAHQEIVKVTNENYSFIIGVMWAVNLDIGIGNIRKGFNKIGI